MDDLLAPWTQALGTAPAVRAAGRDVLARYGQAHRRYHDRVHLAEVLAALRTLATPGPLPVPVVCAAYWHDAVYDGAADDEQRSADLAARVLTGLGTPPHVVDEVVRLVLLTVTHDPAPDDGPGALLCDADLAVLAADEDRYLRYAQDEPGMFRTAFAAADELTDDDDATGDSGRPPFGLLTAALDDLVSAGVLPPRRRPDAELMAWSAVHGLSMLLIDGPLSHLDRADADRVGRQLLDHVEAGLLG